MPVLAPAIGALAGSLTATLAAGGLGAALIRIGASVVLSAAAQALMPRPRMATTVTLRQPVAPREIVYGRTRKGGVVVFMDTTGPRGRYLHLVVALAGHRVKSIGAIHFDGEEAVDASGTALGRWAGRVTVETRLGSADQTAFPGLMAALQEKWTAAHRLRGVAAIHLRLDFDRDAFPSGIPNITVDLEGKDDILDPRTGLRGYSENPALCLADYMADPVFGLGAGIGEIDGIAEEALIEAATICDEIVPTPEGGNEPRYSCNGVLSMAETPKAAIEALLTAMAGRAVWQGGQWRLHAGAWRAPDLTFGPGDVREGGWRLSTRISLRENFNGVRGRFVSPENDWQPDDFPAWQSPVHLAEDLGEARWRDLDLPFTISPAMAQRLARIALARARCQMTLRMEGKLSCLRAAAGETVRIDHPRWGFAAKPFEVLGFSLEIAGEETPAALPALLLRETSPLVHDPDASELAIYAAAPRTALPSAFDIAPPGVPTVTEALYVTREGQGVRALARLVWTEAQSSVVERYEVQARRSVAGIAGDWQDYGPTSTLAFEIRDIAPGDWEFRVRAVSLLGVRSEWRTRARTILGLTAPPQPLEGLSLQTAGGLAILKWRPSADLDVRIGGEIVIRHSAADPPGWASSVGMDNVAGAEAIAVVPLKPGAYLVRARDNSGNLGPVAMVATAGAQALAFSPLGMLQADPAFPGARTNLTVADGRLSLAEVGLGEGLYHFAAGLDLGSLRPIRLRSRIAVLAALIDDLISARTELVSDWPSLSGGEGADVDVVMEIRTTPDDPAGSPLWSGWSRVDATELEARGIEARARLTVRDPDYNLFVSELRLLADEVS